MEDRFNLIDEEWIPISLHGKVSLKQIFEDSSLKSIGGTVVQKLAVLKLLLAIAQRASTPEDDSKWREMEAEGLGRKCIKYLEDNRDLFFLYGEKPFLQFPALNQEFEKGKTKFRLKEREIGTNYLPDLPSDNNSIINSYQINKPLSDADKALFIVSIMNYSLGGKRVDKDSPIFTSGYSTKKSSAKPGPSLGNYIGYLQTCFEGENALDTVWLNLLSKENLDDFPQYKDKPIIPPWESMPKGEDDQTARQIKDGLMGPLCGMCRFVYLKGDGIIYTDGIQYPSHKEGWREPFMAYTNDTQKIAWVDPSKQPWRSMTALLELSFVGTSHSFNCPQISELFRRNRKARDIIGIFSGGLRVRATSGDQSVKQNDDFVEDSIFLTTSILNEEWFLFLKREMQALDGIATVLYSCIRQYWTEMKQSNGNQLAEAGTEQFWEECDKHKQSLFNKVRQGDELLSIRRIFSEIAARTYNNFCPKETASQICNWAKTRPSFSKYLSLKEEETTNAKQKK